MTAMPPVANLAAALELPVSGRRLPPGTLRDQLGSQPTLLVFLRHFG